MHQRTPAESALESLRRARAEADCLPVEALDPAPWQYPDAPAPKPRAAALYTYQEALQA